MQPRGADTSRIVALVGVVLAAGALSIWEFHVEVFAIFVKLYVLAAIFIKNLLTVAFWKKVPLVVWPWLKRTLFKLLFVQIPMAVLTPLASVGLLEPAQRRAVAQWMRNLRLRVTGAVGSVRRRFDAFFGVNGMLGFLMSFMLLMLLAGWTAAYLGHELWIWIGGAGPLAPVFAAIGRGIVWLVDNRLHRVPALGRILKAIGQRWRRDVAPLLPGVDARRRRLMWHSLRQVRRQRLWVADRRRRAWKRLKRLRKAVRARQAKAAASPPPPDTPLLAPDSAPEPTGAPAEAAREMPPGAKRP